MNDSIVSDVIGVYGSQRTRVKVADEVWIATALLHKEHPEQADFAVSEIRERLQRERLAGVERAGVQAHIAWHCVANYAPQPGRYRMLYATTKARRRLYRPGDPCDQKREGGKMVPLREDMPERYRGLLDWYEESYAGSLARRKTGAGKETTDPILTLRGLGKELKSKEHPDAHVAKLREGWV